MNMQNRIKNAIDFLESKEKELEVLATKQVLLQEDRKRNVDKVRIFKEGSEVAKRTAERIQRSIEEFNKQYLKSLEDLVNSVLKYSFHDQNYEFKIVPEDKKLEFKIIDHLKGIEKTLDKLGGGISIIISVFLQIYFITERNHERLIIADECLYAISEEYRERFYHFIRKYTQENNFYVFVISHDKTTSKYMDFGIDIREFTGEREERA